MKVNSARAVEGWLLRRCRSHGYLCEDFEDAKQIRLFYFFVALGISVILFLPVVLAQESALPSNLQKIIEYNQQNSMDFGVKISFFIAFLAGMLGILSPCFLPLLPAYFSNTFKEKKNITKMTLVFFAGFAAVFVGMGVIAGFIGEQSLSVLQKGWVVVIGGWFLSFWDYWLFVERQYAHCFMLIAVSRMIFRGRS